MIEVLKDIDLFEDRKADEQVINGQESYRYDFNFETMRCHGEFQVEGSVNHGNRDKLWTALVSSISYFATFYENAAIREAAMKVGEQR